MGNKGPLGDWTRQLRQRLAARGRPVVGGWRTVVGGWWSRRAVVGGRWAVVGGGRGGRWPPVTVGGRGRRSVAARPAQPSSPADGCRGQAARRCMGHGPAPPSGDLIPTAPNGPGRHPPTGNRRRSGGLG